MTQKELLYTEDAIGHENTIIKVCEDLLNNLEDEDLKEFISEEINIHSTMKDKLINLLEGESNE